MTIFVFCEKKYVRNILYDNEGFFFRVVGIGDIIKITTFLNFQFSKRFFMQRLQKLQIRKCIMYVHRKNFFVLRIFAAMLTDEKRKVVTMYNAAFKTAISRLSA